MTSQPEISQRDLRLRSKEIMDSVERGESFTVTRDGHQIGELIPLRRRRTFVPRADFIPGSPSVIIEADRLRADIDSILDADIDDPYDR